jgi:hypothetical protein
MRAPVGGEGGGVAWHGYLAVSEPRIYLIARSGNCSEFEDEGDEFTIDGEGADITLLPQPFWVVFAFSVCNS